MQEFHHCHDAFDRCMSTRRFAIAHLYPDEGPADTHIHDCYEIYYAISGGRQFLIDNQLYPIRPGDLFSINQYESHYLTNPDAENLERLVIAVHPDFVHSLSSRETDLDSFFMVRNRSASHRHTLTPEQQQTFLHHISRLLSIEGFGSDVLEVSRFIEFLVFLNAIHQAGSSAEADRLQTRPRYNPQIQEAISYINQHISEPISLSELASQLYLSESYLCRIFKASTGTTISKYIVSRRITIAKSLLATGHSVAESQELCGFNDYSNFLKAFTRIVGISPKKYSQLCLNQADEES